MSSEMNKQYESKLKSLEAFFSSQEKGTIEGLSILGDSLEPDIIRRKLSVLLDAGQANEAIKIIKEITPHERWCDKALYAYVTFEDFNNAKKLIEWTKTIDDELLRNRCRLIYAEARYDYTFRNRPIEKNIFPHTLSKDEKEGLEDVIYILNPIILKVIAEKKIYNEIESLVLQCAIKIYYLFGDSQQTSNLTKMLIERKPIPLDVVRLALSKFVEIQKDIPERLRNEHPDSLEAMLLSAALEAEIFNEYTQAYDNIKNIDHLIESEEDKLNYCKILYQISQYLGELELQSIEEKCTVFLGKSHPVALYVQAERAMRKRDYETAKRCVLECKNENDANWLQVYAKYLLETKNSSEALTYFNKARAILPHPELLRAAARIAYETENYDLSIDILKQALNNEPKDIYLLNNLSNVYYKKGDYENAMEQFHLLTQLEPDELSYFLNLASCYTQLGFIAKAINAYGQVCARKNAPLEAYIAKAYLERVSDPQKAFDTLLPLKEKYWENSQYLQAVLDLSYKAGREEYAHQAMLKLLELQQQGKVSQEIIQAKTLEDLKIYAKHWNDKIKLLNENLLTGKFPWIMADHWQNHATYMGWYVRTQPLGWRIEEPLTCATFSIYSTNGFKVVKNADGTTKLGLIDCPPPKTDVVVDLSALITLHQLRLLDKCKEYFNEIIIPQEYITILLHDTSNLSDIQLSMKTSADAIKKMIDTGDISILENIGSPGQRPLPFINEHTLPDKEDEHYYRLIDLLNVAYNAGKLDETKYNNLKRIAHQSSGNDTEHPALRQGQSIYVDSLTLRSICQIDLDALSPIIDTFKVYISNQDKNRIITDLLHILKQEEIKQKSNELLQIIRDDIKIIKKEHAKDSQLKNEDEYFESWLLEKQECMPLLADDRMLQALTLNGNTTVENASFGTDRLLLKMYEENIIDIAQLSGAYLKLMEWRYRFIIPTKEILLHLAKKFKNHPPGEDLQSVALYLHDCLRDPGLFAGKEKTTLQKESIASRIFAYWIIHLIPEFLAEIWAQKEEYDEAIAKKLTEWITLELMPSLPRNIGPNSLDLVRMIPKSLLTCFISQTYRIKDNMRANRAMQIIAECMNMDEAEYCKAVSGAIDIYEI